MGKERNYLFMNYVCTEEGPANQSHKYVRICCGKIFVILQLHYS